MLTWFKNRLWKGATAIAFAGTLYGSAAFAQSPRQTDQTVPAQEQSATTGLKQATGLYLKILQPGVQVQRTDSTEEVQVPAIFRLDRQEDRDAWSGLRRWQRQQDGTRMLEEQRTLERLTIPATKDAATPMRAGAYGIDDTTRASLSASGATTHLVRRHLSRYDPMPFPLLDLTPKYYRLVASKDPVQHLGDPTGIAFDRPSYEAPSDWRSYAPMTAAFDATAQGKTDDLDRIVAFGTWLGATRPFGFPPMNGTPSAIEMFNASQIMCWYASVMTTLDAWWHGTPAISGETWNETHQMTTAQVLNGRGVPEWMLFNANGGWPTTYVYNQEDAGDRAMRALGGLEDRVVDVFYNVPVPGTGETIAELDLFKMSVIDDSERAALYGNEIGTKVEFGTVDFPNNARIFYADTNLHLSDQNAPGSTPVKLIYRIEAVDQTCLNDLGIGYMSPLKYIIPGMLWRGTTTDGQPAGVLTMTASGRFETILPYAQNVSNHPQCDAYNMVYYMTYSNLDVNDADGAQTLAYQRFSVSTGPVSLDPSQLQAYPGAKQEYVDYIKNLLQQIPPKEKLPLAPY